MFSLVFFLQAGHNLVCERHKSILITMRAKRKRKDSEEESDYQPEVSVYIRALRDWLVLNY